MRASNTYRGKRRNEAKAAGFPWRFLDMIVDGNGSQTIAHPFSRLGKPATADAMMVARASVRGTEPKSSDVVGAALRSVRSERGVGHIARIAEAVRASFVLRKIRHGK